MADDDVLMADANVAATDDAGPRRPFASSRVDVDGGTAVANVLMADGGALMADGGEGVPDVACSWWTWT